MIDELRIYTLAAGRMRDYLEAAEHIAVPARGDRYGRLLGFWTGAVGALNRVFNLWRHDSLDERARLRAELARLPAWRNDYLPRVRPLMVDQTIRLLEAVVPPSPATSAVGCYEFRFVRARAGRASEIASFLAQPIEAGAATTIGVWTTIAPDPNEVVQLCAVSDVAMRLTDPRDGSSPARLLDACPGAIDRVDSSLVVPAHHSPLR